MNKSAFLKLIKQVSDISDQQQSELEQVAVTFPYCQTAHLLLAKSAYDKGSMLSTQRLRRASAYATDRQLLKRLIYASPVLEPVYADEPEETEVAEATIQTRTTQDLQATTAEPEQVEKPEVTQNTAAEPATSEALPSGIAHAPADEAIPAEVDPLKEATPETAPEEESLDQVYSHTSAENTAYTAQENEADDDAESPKAEIDSELALLFTFSSISPSSTDLLHQREAEAEHDELSPDSLHISGTAEALQELDGSQQPATQDSAIPEEDATLAIPIAVEEIALPSDEALPVEDVEQDTLADALTATETSKTADEDAEINYSIDEIDRLYAEDALGYWMGSSRMGEVLQLKDDYTRQRPQSFHPELILEYSKTHELEKAIQPTAHVLSKQLDIIDQFLKLNPKLKTMASLKLKPEPQEDLSLKSSKIKKGIASESLANIFIKQGKTKKAVKIYEQLILKYPEKKSYFAEQIEKLQNIT